jgi:teichuronic acid biosynthesis glycosyltransferase TuaG
VTVPLVSIVTPMFNSSDFIEGAIKSVLAQSIDDWEMIVVDDKSSDDSVEKVKFYSAQDKRIKLIQLDTNSGPAIARNAALDLAQGEYVAFLDSDDLWESTFLEDMYKFSDGNGYDFTFASYKISDESLLNYKRDFVVPLKVTYEGLLKKTSISCLTAFIKRQLIGDSRMQNITHEDYVFWLRILKKTGYAYGFQKALAVYRKRSGSITSNRMKSALATWDIYRKIEHLSFLKSVYYFSNYAFNAVVKYYI